MTPQEAIQALVRNKINLSNGKSTDMQVVRGAQDAVLADKILSQYAILPSNASTIRAIDPVTKTITYTFVNATGAAINYNVIGNSTINTPDGRTYVAPTTCSDGSAGAIINKYLISHKIRLTSMVYQCGTGTGITQFPQRFGMNQGDFGNFVNFRPVNTAIATSAQNFSQDILNFIIAWEIDNNSNLVITVAATTSVTMSFTYEIID